MAALVTLTDIVLAFPIAYYMARVASPRTRGAARRLDPAAALVRLPRQGLRLAADPRRERRAQLGSRAVRAARARATATSRSGSWCQLPLAAVHDHPDLRGPRADPELAARGVGGPRRPAGDDVPAGRSCRWSSRRSSPARSSRSPDARRLHHADAGLEHAVHRQRRSTTTSASPATSRSPPRTRWSRSRS